MSFSGGGAAHLSGLPDGTTCSLAKRSASDETAEQVAESAGMCSLAKRSASEEIAEPVAERVQQWWGKDYSALKRLALRAVACGNVLSLRSSRTLVEASHPSPWGRI